MAGPQVSFGYVKHGDDDPAPFRAHIVTDHSDHHGMGATQHEALLNAAVHWHAYEERKTQEPTNGQ